MKNSMYCEAHTKTRCSTERENAYLLLVSRATPSVQQRFSSEKDDRSCRYDAVKHKVEAPDITGQESLLR